MPRYHRLGAVVAVVGLLAGLSGCGLFGDDGPEKLAAAFTTAWSAGDDARAAALTDDPAAARDLLAAVRRSLAPTGLAATVSQVRTGGDQATASVDVHWDLGQDRMWSYLGEIGMHPAPGSEFGWLVAWRPTVVHPELAPGQQLRLVTSAAPPAPVLDRAGTPLLAPSPVVSVLLDRQAAGDLPAVAGALARALGPIDRRITEQSIVDGAVRTPDGQAYQVAVLREADYRAVKSQVHDLPGVRFTTMQRLLAPDAGFGSQVLPGVRTEMRARLDGVPGWSVEAVGPSGTVVRTLVDQPPRPGAPVTVTLDRDLQAAAEDAVEPVPQQAVLVAVQPSSGAVLAVAQNGPADAAGPIALTGRYPPGSTFKIVTAAAAMARDGLTPSSTVECPPRTSVGGREIPNDGGFGLGSVSLTKAFARSCNTTFARLGASLGPDALPDAALSLGLGADYAVPGVITVTGSVPASDDAVQRAEDAFGQGQVLASPLGMALVTATVAAGRPVVPQLIQDRPTEVLRAPGRPDPAVLERLRPMMRAVVTEGTASRLAGLGDLFGKTGTAEFTGDGRSHGWFVGYRDDLAFAVLVVDGGSSQPALQITQRFLGQAT